ncbi:dienelactone hydrolase family protein [Zavarzinia sp.]|uniref:dienelactone hydrolase family protein n=1 Tax=Zavarzinia sp. TaxID=2027920 RepID=UPI00356142F1
MDQRIIDLYDRYTHEALPRRDFLDRLARLAGGTAAALALLPLLENDYARAETVASDDPRVVSRAASYDGARGAVTVYEAQPAGGTAHGHVVVIHENRGLNAHIRDIARRLALDGFHAVAPDLLSSAGGTPADEDQARNLIGTLDPAKTLADAVAVAAVAYAGKAGGKVGTVGFCWGGGLAGRLATASPALAAAVVYYGMPPASADVPEIKAKLLLHYAGLDQRILGEVPAFETALKAAGKDYQAFVYEGAQHAFNNDTNAARYDKAAADLAWGRTIAFLKATLA